MVGVPAGEVGQRAAGLEKGDVVPAAAGELAQCLGDMAFPDADRAVQDDRLAGGEEAQGGKVADRGDGQPGRDGEVELLQADLFVEAGGAQPPADGGGGAPAGLVLAEDLEELEVEETAYYALPRYAQIAGTPR